MQESGEVESLRTQMLDEAREIEVDQVRPWVILKAFNPMVKESH